MTHMNPFNILLAESSGKPCSDDRSHNLKSILETSALGSHLRMHSLCIDRLHTVHFEPDLVVIRFGPASLRAWKNLIEKQQEWKAAKLIGAFCGNTGSREIAQTLAWGLADYVLCPWREADMAPRLERLLPSSPGSQVAPDGSEARKSPFRVDSLIGESPCFLRQLERIPLLARVDVTVLILGETGTGKELFARAIHYHSPRAGQPFIPINCGALPDELFESELFGHAKGAFTNAFARQSGLVEEAEGGTLFLDEIDALSLSGQAKLLRFLQDKQYRPLGQAKLKTADVRVLAATNVDLRQRMQDHQFREDLYYRLNVTSLSIPPLRNRVEDISLLARHFLSKYGRQYGKLGVGLIEGALDKLVAHAWPGNVRELEGTIQSAVLLSSSLVVMPQDITVGRPPVQGNAESQLFREAKAQAGSAFERLYLVKLLTTWQGNITHAAKAAGKERRTFQRLLRKHDLNRDNFLSPS
jgi:transcriptional regulator with PAS, ATPase and Fis domain